MPPRSTLHWGSLAFLVPQTRIKNIHLWLGNLLHYLFYLWEVKIDFLPFVTLKSQTRPFCYTLKEFSGMGIKGLGSCSFKRSKRREKPWWAALSIYVSNLFHLQREYWLRGWTTCKVLTWHKFFSFFFNRWDKESLRRLTLYYESEPRVLQQSWLTGACGDWRSVLCCWRTICSGGTLLQVVCSTGCLMLRGSDFYLWKQSGSLGVVKSGL